MLYSPCNPSWKKFSENFLKFTEIYLNHIWKIAYYHFVPLNQFWTHFSNIAELSEKSELFWICLKNLNCFENCWNSLNSICIVLKQSELFWILLKYSILDFISINPDVIFCLKQLFEICWNFDADQFLIWWNLMLFKCWNMSAIENSKLMHFSEKSSISPIFHLNKTIKLNRLFQMVLKMCEFTYQCVP